MNREVALKIVRALVGLLFLALDGLLRTTPKKLNKRRQAAKELGISPRQVRRLWRLWEEGGQVVHALRRRASNHRLSGKMRDLLEEVYQGLRAALGEGVTGFRLSSRGDPADGFVMDMDRCQGTVRQISVPFPAVALGIQSPL
jgi:hypothetical protein